MPSVPPGGEPSTAPPPGVASRGASRAGDSLRIRRQIAEQIPALRRYAAALAGSRPRGDSYVRACLEVVLAEARPLGSIRVALFATLNTLWNSVEAVAPEPVPDGAGDHDGRWDVAGLPPRERQAVLLILQEGFSLGEAAHLLGLPGHEVRARLTGIRRRTSNGHPPAGRRQRSGDEKPAWYSATGEGLEEGSKSSPRGGAG